MPTPRWGRGPFECCNLRNLHPSLKTLGVKCEVPEESFTFHLHTGWSCRFAQRTGSSGGARGCRDMDDVERAILYSFDETNAVSPDLKVLLSLDALHIPTSYAMPLAYLNSWAPSEAQLTRANWRS